MIHHMREQKQTAANTRARMKHAPPLCAWMAREHGIHSRRDALSLTGNAGKRQEETEREKAGSRRIARARLRLERQMVPRSPGPVRVCLWLTAAPWCLRFWAKGLSIPTTAAGMLPAASSSQPTFDTATQTGKPCGTRHCGQVSIRISGIAAF